MKKTKIAALLITACTLALAGAACNLDDSSTPAPSAYTLTFTPTSGVTFITEHKGEVAENTKVSFSLKISSFYTGTPIVTINGEEIFASDEGVYTFIAKKDSVINVAGLSIAEADLTGSGASDDAFVIDCPADLVYVAERVNDGDATYRSACYVLAKDLDCEGQELAVIGDGRTDEAYFEGVFNGQGYTISNFEINTNGSLYVGLFGWVVAAVDTTNTGAIYSLNLDNYEINATSASDEIMSCGSLVGYSIGYTITQCNTTNGVLNIHADAGFPAYIGGIVGFMQSIYLDQTSAAYTASIAYCVADVDVYGNYGQILAAGGVVGYTMTNSDQVIAYVVNCYSTGDILGAIRAGGVIGNLGKNTSVLACYAIGDVSALSTLSDDSVSPEFCSAYAGGVVGFAENDSVIADCFAAGKTSAYAKLGDSQAHVGGVVAGGDPAGNDSVTSRAYVINNCYDTTSGVDLKSANFQENVLKFPTYDWVLADGEYPAINYSYSESTVFNLTLDFGEYTIDGNKDNTIPFQAHFGFIYLYASETLPEYITASESDNIYSYGYFFDEACSVPVPYSFITTRDITIYVGFANHQTVAGKYQIYSKNDNAWLSLEVKANGTYVYDDGSIKTEAYYIYDGKNIQFLDARFARYQSYAFYAQDGLTEEEITLMADQLSFRDFYADVNPDGTLSIYDGVYFTKNAPLTAKLDNSTPTEQTNKFIGTWDSAQAIGFSYQLNADGTFTYNGNTKQTGTYVIDPDANTRAILTFANATTKTAILESSYLYVDDMPFYGNNSYQGSWISFDYGAVLYLDGIASDGVGTGSLLLASGTKYSLVYLAESGKTLDGYITIYSENQFVGSLKLSTDGKSLTGRLYNQQTSIMDSVTFRLFDALKGEWISEESAFAIVDFNGLGNYDMQWGNLAQTGMININGEDVEYALIDKFTGSFIYNNVSYQVKLDIESGRLIVSSGASIIHMQRKDVFANVSFLDENGANYVFDGRGALGTYAGTMTVTNTDGTTSQYAYQTNGETIELQVDTQTGSIAVVENNYQFSWNGQTTKLYQKTAFTGEWAINGMNALFTIGGIDNNGKAIASYPIISETTGKIIHITVECTYESEDLLTFTYGNATMYVYTLSSGGIMLSTTKNPYAGTYTVAALKDELFGTWTTASKMYSFTFDGSSNTNAETATASQKVLSTSQAFNYMERSNGKFLVWSTTTIGDKTVYYVVEWCKVSDRDAYINEDKTKAFKLVEVDALYMLEAKDSQGIVYTFDGMGNVTASNGSIYTYTVKRFNNNNTAVLVLVKDDVEYNVMLDYSGTEISLIFN